MSAEPQVGQTDLATYARAAQSAHAKSIQYALGGVVVELRPNASVRPPMDMTVQELRCTGRMYVGGMDLAVTVDGVFALCPRGFSVLGCLHCLVDRDQTNNDQLCVNWRYVQNDGSICVVRLRALDVDMEHTGSRLTAYDREKATPADTADMCRARLSCFASKLAYMVAESLGRVSMLEMHEHENKCYREVFRVGPFANLTTEEMIEVGKQVLQENLNHA